MAEADPCEPVAALKLCCDDGRPEQDAGDCVENKKVENRTRCHLHSMALTKLLWFTQDGTGKVSAGSKLIPTPR